MKSKRIKFDKNNQDQVDLIKAAGSRNMIEAKEAQQILAQFLSPVVKEVIETVGTASLIYEDMEFQENQRPEFPLDIYYDKGEGEISVFEQQTDRGLASNHIQSGGTYKFTTYKLGSAFDISKNYARFGNLDIVAKAITRMSQEILQKQEDHAWSVIMAALANASTGGADHIITTGTQDTLGIDDFNNLLELFDEINQSYSGGTSLGSYYGATDIFLSHTAMSKIRAMSYNPLNTLGANQVAGTNASGVIGMPDADRAAFFRSGRAPEIFGMTFHKLLELKDNGRYSQLFDTYIGSSTVAHGSSQFATDDQIVVAVDLSRDAFYRAVSVDSEIGSSVVVNVDDQYSARDDKMGWYTDIEEGRVCIDAKVLAGMII